MTDSSPLTRAYELIESNRPDDARALLQALLTRDEDNVDAWWLYAHAVSDVENARRALQNVRRLDPAYPGLAELSSALERVQHASAETVSKPAIKSLGRAVPPPPSLPDESPFDVEEFDAWGHDDYAVGDLQEEPEESPLPGSARRSGRTLLIAVVTLVIIIAGVALVVLNRSRAPLGAPTPTAGAQVAAATTAAPTVTAITEMTPTIEALPSHTPTVGVQSSPISPDLSSFASALDGFVVPADGVVVSETALGETVVVTVCAERSALTAVMGTIARTGATFADRFDAIAARIGDCNQDSSMRTIGMAIADAAAYADGLLSEQDFQRAWRPLG